MQCALTFEQKASPLTIHSASCHCTQRVMSLYTACHVTIHSVSCHYTQRAMSLYTACHVTVHSVSCHYTQRVMSLYTACHVTVHSVSCHLMPTFLVPALYYLFQESKSFHIFISCLFLFSIVHSVPSILTSFLPFPFPSHFISPSCCFHLPLPFSLSFTLKASS